MNPRSPLYSLSVGNTLLCLTTLLQLLCSVQGSSDLQPCWGSGLGSGDVQSSNIDYLLCASSEVTPTTTNIFLVNTVSRETEVVQQSSSVASPLSTESTSMTDISASLSTTVEQVIITTTQSASISASTTSFIPAIMSTETVELTISSLTPTPLPQTTVASSTAVNSATTSPVETIVSLVPSPSAVMTSSSMVVTSLVAVTSSAAVTSSPEVGVTNQITTTSENPGSLSVFDRIRQFFEGLDTELQISIYVGAAIVVILLLVVCCLCCCCICSRLRKKRKGKMDLTTNHRTSLTISNPIALVSSPNGHNGTAPARYRSTIHGSSQYSDSYNVDDDQEPFNFPSNEYHETSIDEAERTFAGQASQVHATQPSQMTQMSVATDIFRERSLPKLSPLSYSSQLLTAPQFPNHYPSLSVDENDPHSAIGSRRPSLMAIIPNTSPSLRVPTLMALSLKNEESKSAQGSKVSVHGSRTSIQGSRPSVSGSRGSVYTGTGSRSQIYSSNLSSREHSALLLNGTREFGGAEDDVVSLPLSGRGISPAMKQSSLEEVPTRDSPVPEVASHAVRYGKKDFASLTCIPNQYAVEAERLEDKQQLSTVPEKHMTESESTAAEKEQSTDAKKKTRSRAMSKLEKLTSLDYIRASLRLKKKRVSFSKTTESSPKHKEKKGNSNLEDKGREPPTIAEHPPKELHQNRRHSASARAEFSPLNKTPPTSANKFPEHYYYPQLSQPMYYGGGASMMHPAVFYQYPQLSQQYYAQLSQGGYGGGHYPPHMVYPHGMVDPYGRSYAEPPTTRYANMVTPELFDDTPEPEFYQERSPDNVLGERQQPNGFGDQFQSPEHSSLRPSSPDRFTETSETSSYLMQPPSATHLHDDPLTSAHKHFMDEFVMDKDYYGYGVDHHHGYGVDHQHVPTYPGDMMGRAPLVSEAYREVVPLSEMPQAQDYVSKPQSNGQYTQYPGYAGAMYNTAPRRPSRSSFASSTSEHGPPNDSNVDDEESNHCQQSGTVAAESTSSKTRVSWSTEVIEYQRTPSDMADSDFDFNQF